MLLITYLPIIRYYKKHYNMAERNRALWLANVPDPFASGLHADISLFTFLRQSLFFVLLDIASCYLTVHSVAKNMETSSASSWHDDVELPNFDLNLFANLRLSPLRDLQIWASGSWIIWLNKDIQRRPKKQQTGLVSTFRGKPSIVTIPQCFPAI